MTESAHPPKSLWELAGLLPGCVPDLEPAETPPAPGNAMPLLWLTCSESREGLCETVDACLEVTPAWAQDILARVRLLQSLKALSGPPHLYEMKYWDYAPVFMTRLYDPPADLVGLEVLYEDLDPETAVYCSPGGCPWPMPDDANDPRYASVECPLLHVQDDGVYWSVLARHTDVRLSTTTIPLRDLERYAAGEEPASVSVVRYVENPHAHESGPHGCEEECSACAWLAGQPDDVREY